MKWSLQQQASNLKHAAEPASLRRAALSRVSAQTSAASRATEQASAAERLTQLGELVDAGLVTDAEYEEKRQSIVSQL